MLNMMNFQAVSGGNDSVPSFPQTSVQPEAALRWWCRLRLPRVTNEHSGTSDLREEEILDKTLSPLY